MPWLLHLVTFVRYTCAFFLTIPVTVGSCERSLSKLKIVKNYFRSTKPQERLSDLALLSIDKERARMINVAKMIDVLAEQKAKNVMSGHSLKYCSSYSTIVGLQER